MFSGLLPKDLFKRKRSLAKSYFKQNYCHACHTRLAVFFPLPSCCVSSLMRETRVMEGFDCRSERSPLLRILITHEWSQKRELWDREWEGFLTLCLFSSSLSRKLFETELIFVYECMVGRIKHSFIMCLIHSYYYIYCLGNISSRSATQ